MLAVQLNDCSTLPAPRIASRRQISRREYMCGESAVSVSTREDSQRRKKMEGEKWGVGLAKDKGKELDIQLH